MALISENLANAICEQIGFEKYNSHLYLYICGYLKNKGLDNIAKHFEGQHKEEFEHSLMFFNLLTDLNADVFVPEVDEVSMPFNTILDIAKVYLDREISTTSSINELKKLAMSEDNPVVEEKMRDMIRIQQNEYEEATTFMDKATLLSEWWQVAIWNESIG